MNEDQQHEIAGRLTSGLYRRGVLTDVSAATEDTVRVALAEALGGRGDVGLITIESDGTRVLCVSAGREALAVQIRLTPARALGLGWELLGGATP